MDLDKLPTQTGETGSAEPVQAGPPKLKRRGRKRKAKPTLEASKKIGVETIGRTKADFLKSYFNRRRLLTVPQEIKQAHPDKHFCFLSMNKLQRNGMWHPGGYRVFNLAEHSDKENQLKEKFNSGMDDYLHRNEMVLAWIPKEEQELRQMEFDIARGKKDVTDLISKNPNLSAFNAHADKKEATYKFPEGETVGG